MAASTGSGLRRITDPVVAAGPAGVRICTRIHVCEEEQAALWAVGEFLGSVYRSELANRIGLGVLDHDGQAAWRAQRKRAITAVASSRWAGAITRAVEDQYQSGMRALVAHIADLRAAIAVLEARCALRPGEVAAAGPRPGRKPRLRGYRSAGERFVKTRRLAGLRERLAAAEAALVAGRPSVVVGGKRLWRHREHLEATQMSVDQWRGCWDCARMFVTADGESGKAGGNETIRVDDSGRLRIKVPAALVDTLGTHIVVGAPVCFSHRGDEWAARVAITTLLDVAEHQGCAAIVVENLDFADARATGHETLGRGAAGKRFRRTVAGIPTTKFRTRLTAMAARRGIAVIGADPAYTSKWGNQHWTTPLQQQTSVPVTRHHGAAAAIGRRGLGLAIRRRPAGPRNGQRTAVGTPPTRPDHQPAHGGRHGSSGSPTRTRCVPVHRKTPASRGQHRSGRNQAGLTPAH